MRIRQVEVVVRKKAEEIGMVSELRGKPFISRGSEELGRQAELNRANW